MEETNELWTWLTEMPENDFNKFYGFFNYFGTSGAGGVIWAAQIERDRRKGQDADPA